MEFHGFVNYYGTICECVCVNMCVCVCVCVAESAKILLLSWMTFDVKDEQDYFRSANPNTISVLPFLQRLQPLHIMTLRERWKYLSQKQLS